MKKKRPRKKILDTAKRVIKENRELSIKLGKEQNPGFLELTAAYDRGVKDAQQLELQFGLIILPIIIIIFLIVGSYL